MKFPKKTIRQYLRAMAGWSWREQGHAFKHGLALQEETITEMLLLRMAKDRTKHGVKVRMFTKNEEGKNGADWEWIVKTASCEVGFRVQAKRLYHKDKNLDYGGLDVNPSQTDKLIKHAEDCDRIPVYVFYNHAHGKHSKQFDTGTEAGFRGPSYWGCSIASAEKVKAKIKEKKSNKLADLKPIMKPWHHLFSESGTCNTQSALGFAPDASGETPPSQHDVVEFLRASNIEALEGYLRDNELEGAALIDFSNFRGN